MSRFTDLRDVILPLLDRPGAETLRAQETRRARDLACIDAQGWSAHTDVALEEARRIFDAEMARRASADSKATTYMAVIAALVPIGLSVQGAVVEGKIGSAPSWLNLTILAIGMLYVIGAGLWAFRVLKVSAAARTDVPDVQEAWRRRDPRIHVVRATLKAARMNWSGVNEKINGIRMAHEYLMRAFLVFAMLLIVNAGWTLVSTAYAAMHPKKTFVVKMKPRDAEKARPYMPKPVASGNSMTPLR